MWISRFLAAPLVVEPVLEAGVLHLDARRRRKFNILRHRRFPESEHNAHSVHGTFFLTHIVPTRKPPSTLYRNTPEAVLRIRDVYPGFEFFSIPDPNFSIPDPGSKRFPDPGPHLDFLPISDPGSKGLKGTGSGIWIRNTS
jgi:hypothetical protein